MKKPIIAVIIAAIVLIAAAIYFVPEIRHNRDMINARLEYDKVRIKKGMDDYGDAINKATLYACTGMMANFNGISLQADFYPLAKSYSANATTKGSVLKQILINAKHNPSISDKAAKTIDEAMQDIFPNDNQPYLANNVTRGFCINFAKGFIDDVNENLAFYRVTPAKAASAPNKPNAIYMDTTYKVMRMTASVADQAQPTTLVIGSQAYPVQCHYQDGLPFVQAIASKAPRSTLEYKASDYFYQHYSPQINAVLTCRANVDLPAQSYLVLSDTYPWYQPTVTGNPNNEPAAGDAMAYVQGKQFIIVLGHEPCVCNGQTAQQCANVKTISRSFNNVAWPLITTLQAEAPKHNAKAQAYMKDYFNYAESQLRHDFCYIDRDGIMAQLDAMLHNVAKVEKPLYVNGKPIAK